MPSLASIGMDISFAVGADKGDPPTLEHEDEVNEVASTNGGSYKVRWTSLWLGGGSCAFCAFCVRAFAICVRAFEIFSICVRAFEIFSICARAQIHICNTRPERSHS